jgi:16S rRNA processing protein RimM
MTDTIPKNLILVGIISNTKGLKGEVKIKSFTHPYISIKNYDIQDKEGNKYKLVNPYLSGTLIVSKIEGINSIDDAILLKNKELYTTKDSFQTEAVDEFFHFELIDKQVFDKNNTLVGVISAIHNFGAGDILEINLVEGNKVAMINFSKHSVLEIDQSQNLIVIDVKYLIIQ